MDGWFDWPADSRGNSSGASKFTRKSYVLPNICWTCPKHDPHLGPKDIQKGATKVSKMGPPQKEAKGRPNGANMVPKWSQNGTHIASACLQNVSKMVPGMLQKRSRSHLVCSSSSPCLDSSLSFPRRQKSCWKMEACDELFENVLWRAWTCVGKWNIEKRHTNRWKMNKRKRPQSIKSSTPSAPQRSLLKQRRQAKLNAKANNNRALSQSKYSNPWTAQED